MSFSLGVHRSYAYTFNPLSTITRVLSGRPSQWYTPPPLPHESTLVMSRDERPVNRMTRPSLRRLLPVPAGRLLILLVQYAQDISSGNRQHCQAQKTPLPSENKAENTPDLAGNS